MKNYYYSSIQQKFLFISVLSFCILTHSFALNNSYAIESVQFTNATSENIDPMVYWTQTFETVAHRPETSPATAVTITVSGQGDWIYLKAYKGTNVNYITDGSATTLRMLKNGSYVVTPILNDGVATLTFAEGRTGKSITISTSEDGGETWTQFSTISKTTKNNTVSINNPSVNRLKISNDSGNDADIDNVTVTRALPPSSSDIKTNSATNITNISASVSATITLSASTIIESGVCYGTKSTPTFDGDKVVATTDKNNFALPLTGLLSRKTYYARAYAKTTDGDVLYGNQVSFKTLKGDGPLIPNVYYVSPNGDDTTADGSEGDPFFLVQKAIDLVEPGDVIIMKGGTYNYTKRINIGTAGGPGDEMIQLRAEEGKRALLDFSTMPVDGALQGIRLTGSYWHIYGLDIKGAGDNGMLIERNKPTGGKFSDIEALTDQAHDNVIEFCSFFENRDTGLQLKNYAKNNHIINCDSYFNEDPGQGDADGFAPKLTIGDGNYFYGCRAWNNSDDGWDGYLKCTEDNFPDDVVTIIEECWTWDNGFLKDGSKGQGNGNGFKMGGSNGKNQRHNMILKRCLGVNNLSKTFDYNNNKGDMWLFNCTAGYCLRSKESNQAAYNLKTTVADGKEIILTNCIAIWDGKDKSKSTYAPVTLNEDQLTTTCDFLATPDDFVSIDQTGLDAPRKADGSLPDIDFMKIKPGNTRLIDKGTPVGEFDYNGVGVTGINYKGSAPDLGWLETDENNPTGLENSMNNNESSLVIYPQPIVDKFTVMVNNEYGLNNHKIKILDVSGSLVYSNSFYGNCYFVSCENIPSGVYVLVVESTDNTYTQKIIIR